MFFAASNIRFQSNPCTPLRQLYKSVNITKHFSFLSTLECSKIGRGAPPPLPEDPLLQIFWFWRRQLPKTNPDRIIDSQNILTSCSWMKNAARRAAKNVRMNKITFIWEKNKNTAVVATLRLVEAVPPFPLKITNKSMENQRKQLEIFDIGVGQRGDPCANNISGPAVVHGILLVCS